MKNTYSISVAGPVDQLKFAGLEIAFSQLSTMSHLVAGSEHKPVFSDIQGGCR